MSLHWSLKKFDTLTPHELYAILQLRNAVFVVEQNCVYQDADNKDIQAYHLMGWQQDKIVAYTRLLPAGLAFAEPSIGRVLTATTVRKTGAGKQLMQQSIASIQQLFGAVPIRIGAQLYLKKFYEDFGFVQSSSLYLEDNIEHIEMVRN